MKDVMTVTEWIAAGAPAVEWVQDTDEKGTVRLYRHPRLKRIFVDTLPEGVTEIDLRPFIVSDKLK